MTCYKYTVFLVILYSHFGVFYLYQLMTTFHFSWLLGSLLLFTLWSCGNEPPKPAPAVSTVKKMIADEKDRLFLRPLTSYLRVRATPDEEGEILEILKTESILEYLHDSTSFETTVSYQNKEYTASWYKVKTLDTEEGWIYAGLVTFLPDKENQLLAQERAAGEALLAANQSNGESNAEKKEAEQSVQNNILEDYQSYLDRLNASSISSVGLALEQFRIRFAERTNAKTCDAAYIAFDNLHTQVVQSARRSVNLASYQAIANELLHYGTTNMQQSTYTQQLADNGIRFSLKEGKLTLAKDLDFVYRVFFRECSAVMRAYMGQLQEDESMPLVWDEQLKITPRQLAGWVLSWNYFVAKNPDFVWHSTAKQHLRQQLTLLVNGTAKTPIFDQKQLLQKNYKTAYLYISKNYPDSNIGKAFIAYLTLLEEQEWKDSPATKQQRAQIIQELL